MGEVTRPAVIHARTVRPAVRCFLLTFVGLLLVQAAWILTIVPFRGPDEHEHVFKAAAVARGDFSPRHEQASTGWGELVVVPTDLVRAAHPACMRLPYTAPLCDGLPSGVEGTTLAASSAARYNPTYYAVVGVAGLPFSGLTALYVMRCASAMLCAVLAALAVTTITGGARSSAPAVACLLVLAPMYTYASTIVAPNGLEMGAAFLLWACLLRLVGPTSLLDIGTSERRLLVGTATVAGGLLVSLRTLGPLWCLLVVAVCCIAADPTRLRRLVAARRARAGAVVVAGLAASAIAWSAIAGTNDVGAGAGPFPGSPWHAALDHLWRWLQQVIGTAPSRNEIAPPIVYLLVLTTWVVAFSRVAGRLDRRTTVAWALLAASVVAIPMTFTVITWRSGGDIWQGRYGYPIIMGLFLLPGSAAAARLPAGARRGARPVWAVSAVMAGATIFSMMGALHRQTVARPSFADVGLTAPSLLLLAVGCAAGFATIGLALVRADLSDVQPRIMTPPRLPPEVGGPGGPPWPVRTTSDGRSGVKSSSASAPPPANLG